ncbi:hypothetical protein GUITHDRAFT_156379 [Guillardia theta CCMP2712]|uniref:Uncharacterized protein n=1 Tax=Guillardia theta (strain CCMP2712) TaxID=905079 RepID=L1I7S2_GUITC|nr:hypothetical protein GUITHDRAFT_156379 [Guillardia theta CCMP2712]EKX32291.1 hypothetical protein GUITHDRAFT_156379 [Guillardia theta CCMP2712]|eukprot:XP_005819271.1 hypothetical protein GUITHDRAFT_156379 [Guillardia theta CCMP2712]
MHIDAAPSHLNDRAEECVKPSNIRVTSRTSILDEFDTVDKLQQSQRIALAHVDLEVTKPER